jgi:hypothetical protein
MKMEQTKVADIARPMMVPCSACGQSPFLASFSVGADECDTAGVEFFLTVHCASSGDGKSCVRIEADVAIDRAGKPVIFMTEFERHSAKSL